MSKIIDDLIGSKNVSNKKLLDYIIGIQLGKIERYDGTKQVIDSNSEDAMQNLIELLKLRKGQ